MDLLKQIDKERHDFENKDIEVVEGLSFNQKDTLETIYFYHNSKFRTGEIDAEGNRKYFYNINRNPCKIYTKAIDFDTKHIRLSTSGGGDPLKTWFMERDLKYWMKDKRFGSVLNRIFKELPIYGSVVLKIVKGKPFFVDLRNFVVEQSADTLDKANYIIEDHYYVPQEFRKVAKEMGWDKVDEVIKKYRDAKATHIIVHERYGEVEEDGNFTFKKVFVADVGKDRKDKYGDRKEREGVTLSETEIEKLPYYEFHLDKVPGRWLGYGVVESLIEPQIRQNEIVNLQAKGSAWAALRVFQTRDNAINRNLMIDTKNGEILNVDSEITQIDMSDRNLAFFGDETQKWMANRDELTFSYDVVQGERLPAGTPLGSARLAAAMVNSHFDQIRETTALDIKEMIREVMMKQFESENTTEHYLRLTGQDLDKTQNMLINLKAKSRLFGLFKKGIMPDPKQYELIKNGISEAIKQGAEKLIKIPKDFYKDIKYEIDITITGEMKDTQVASQTKFALLQSITTDPNILIDPVKKKILLSIAEDNGVNLYDFIAEERPDLLNMMTKEIAKGAGGGVSALNIGQPLVGEGQATL